MTKYQIAQFKRAVKRDLTKEILSPRGKNYIAEKKERNTHRELPDYIANNPWY
jgi:hypothetical protein